MNSQRTKTLAYSQSEGRDKVCIEFDLPQKESVYSSAVFVVSIKLRGPASHVWGRVFRCLRICSGFNRKELDGVIRTSDKAKLTRWQLKGLEDGSSNKASAFQAVLKWFTQPLLSKSSGAALLGVWMNGEASYVDRSLAVKSGMPDRAESKIVPIAQRRGVSA